MDMYLHVTFYLVYAFTYTFVAVFLHLWQMASQGRHHQVSVGLYTSGTLLAVLQLPLSLGSAAAPLVCLSNLP